MNNRFLSLLFFLALTGTFLYLTTIDRTNPDEELVRHTEKQMALKNAEIKALHARIEQIEQRRHKDSLLFSVVLQRNNSEISRLKRNAEKVTFKDYSDSQLDSVVNFLYPMPSPR